MQLDPTFSRDRISVVSKINRLNACKKEGLIILAIANTFLTRFDRSVGGRQITLKALDDDLIQKSEKPVQQGGDEGLSKKLLASS